MTRAEKTEYLRTLYNFRCGYCGVTESERGGVLTRDHFKPLTQGGRNSVDNMVYACPDCNRAKGDYFSIYPDERLLHPMEDNLVEHLCREPSGEYNALSSLGLIFLTVLELNHRNIVSRGTVETNTPTVPRETVTASQSGCANRSRTRRRGRS